ncbi:TetR/AcrR family transcriptional regulator [Wukongibacter baidiensis]|uniref:TetR/AcrR family transcriptional regulator n=1 Tax=Wukongibacter baidiensis TaxID=1723361 RepID=UPI003D7F7B82
MSKSDKILEAALKLFIKDGFHATPTSKIAKEAGVANGTLFHYFSTKEFLINELYLNVKKHLRNYMIYNLDECRTTREKIKHIWISYVKWAIENPDKYAFFQQFCNSPFINSVSREEGVRSFEFLFAIIEEGLNDGSLIDIDKTLIVGFTFGSTHSVISFAYESPEKFNDEYLEIGFKMYWRGVANI